MTPRTYIQLGKAGDILNLLPLLHQDSLSGTKPRLVIAAEFASILDGVSYVETVVHLGPHYEIAKACESVKAAGDWVSCQVNGPADEVRTYAYQPAGQPGALATSFQKEAWRVCGRLKEWDSIYELKFDQRSSEREAALLKEQGFTGPGRKKPVILLHIGGASSPFPFADLLRETLIAKFGKQYRILEVPKAERLYDLLAIYEKSALLIACDSAPLQLAWACRRLPVFALTNDRNAQGNYSLWHGSSWKPNHLWYCRYHDWPERAAEMWKAIEELPYQLADHNLLRVWSEYEGENTVQLTLGNTLPVYKGSCGRDSNYVLKDTKRVPYLKDVLRMAIQKTPHDETCIILHRPNVRIEFEGFSTFPPFFSYRMTLVENSSPVFSPIADIFCAERKVWRDILALLPDLFLSSDYYWSEVLLNIFKKIGAKDLTGIAYREATPPKAVNQVSKTTEHNRDLCNTFINENRIRSRFPKVSEQLECLPLERDKLFPFGYNPSIIKFNGAVWMAYRYHTGKPNTSLALAKIDETGKVLSNEVLATKPGRSLDDPRLFQVGNTVRVSWVDSSWPSNPVTSVVYVADLMPGLTAGLEHHSLPGNDSTTIQKNYVFFAHKGMVYCIHQCSPSHDIYMPYGKIEGVDSIIPEMSTKAPVWPYGEIRGGTVPLPYEGKLLRFFHSRLNNEWGEPKYRYYIGAYLMNPEPPFEVVRVSKRPVLFGSEIDDLTPAERKQVVRRMPNVVFPAGAIEHGEGWLLSLGVNDCQSVLCKVKPNDLHF